jgi:hypothetical protein
MTFLASITCALHRARLAIATVALAYVFAVAIGIIMVHSGNGAALRYRDRLVSSATANSPILRALRQNRLKTAAALDFAANLSAGTASVLAGYWAPGVYAIALYRGWIGGIVSVDHAHRSRFATPSEAIYFSVVLLLQLLPYSLAGGAGVNIGLARVRPLGPYVGRKLFGVPAEALRDAARIYALVVPLFALASVFEFLVPL